MNAHFNFAKLGGVVEEYAENFYGESTSALHRGTPTDRLVAQLAASREPHVVRRLEQPPELRVRVAGGGRRAGREPHGHRTASGATVDGDRPDASTERRVWIEIPMGFTEMQQQAPELALAVAPARARDVPGLLPARLSRGGFRACSASAGVRALSASSTSLQTAGTLPTLLVTPAARSSRVRRARAGGRGTPSGPPARCS